ncbi:phosphatidylserine decarboxylase family protein [Candidatus Woesearchaeota archaeon]|nr:phosphatidylserine decarboxylase family protein [Candidatus Woesearchaeota archaeon]
MWWLYTVLGIIAGIVLLLLFYYYLWFLRNPVREIPADPKVIVSPTDGKIINIFEFHNEKVKLKKGVGTIKTSTKEVGKEGYIIQIMMTPLDVHYQRSPIEGIVKNISYQKGKFMNAVSTQSLDVLENEKNEVLITNTKQKITVKMIQVAGFLARRIHCFVKKDEKVLKGEQIGVIKLGSQVILIVSNIKLAIKLGDYVYGGSTIIGRF